MKEYLQNSKLRYAASRVFNGPRLARVYSNKPRKKSIYQILNSIYPSTPNPQFEPVKRIVLVLD